jgi:hypothetical protein
VQLTVKSKSHKKFHMTTFRPNENITELKLKDIPEGTTTIDLSRCKKLKELPELPDSITDMNLYECSSLETVPNLSKYTKLTKINFSY